MAVFDWRRLVCLWRLMMVVEQPVLKVGVAESCWDAFLAFVALVWIVSIGIAGKLEWVCVSEFECMYSPYLGST